MCRGDHLDLTDCQLSHLTREVTQISLGRIWQVESDLIKDFSHFLFVLVDISYFNVSLEDITLDGNLLFSEDSHGNESFDRILD